MENSAPRADVHVIILNWNGIADTIDCIRSIEEQEDVRLDITVVDNGSKDNSVKTIREKFSLVQIIENGTNLGFAGGMNVGIRYALSAGAERLFLLNNDTLADKGMMRGLIDEMKGNVGIVAPAIFFENQPGVIWSIGGRIHPLFLELLIPHGRTTTIPSVPLERDFVTGCAMLIHSSVFKQVGFFDESFSPAYYEDLDFCLRVRQRKIRIIVTPTSHLLHKVSQASGGETSPFVYYLMARNGAYYFRKHMHCWQMPFIFLYRLLSAIKTSFRLIFKKNLDALVAYWTGLYDGWLRLKKKNDNQYTSFYRSIEDRS